MESYSIFRDLAIIIIFAKVFGIIARKCKAPQVVGEIIAGLLIGPSVLGLVQQSDFLIEMADVLSTLEVGSTFSAAYRGEQIPTLEEMLACAEDRITLMIELKYSGQEQELEENVLALLQEYDMVDECIIGSMNRGILQRVKELEPDISTVYIAHDLGEDDYDLDYADSYSIEGKNLTADMVEAIHYEGKSVYGWTANTSGAMRQIVNSGADGIVTDDVRLLQAFLRENACRKAFESVY